MKYDLKTLHYISLFENITGTRIKGCLSNAAKIVFIVPPGYLGQSIGKRARNVKKIREITKKDVKIVEYSENPLAFVKGFLFPLKAGHVTIDDDTLTITVNDRKSKALLIGRNSTNLDNLKKIVKDYYHIKKIKII